MFPFYLSLFHVVRAEQSQSLVRRRLKPDLPAYFDGLKMPGTFLKIPFSYASHLLRLTSYWQCLPTKMQRVFVFISAYQQRSKLYISFLSALSQPANIDESFLSALSQLANRGQSFILALSQLANILKTPHIFVKFCVQRCRSTLMRLSTMFSRRTRSAMYQGTTVEAAAWTWS